MQRSECGVSEIISTVLVIISISLLLLELKPFFPGGRSRSGKHHILLRGIVLYEIGRYDESIASYDEVLRIDPDFKEPRKNREYA